MKPFKFFHFIAKIFIFHHKFKTFIFNFFMSIRNGKKVTSDNPWEATTLEWSTPTPPPHGNFVKEPVVYRGPYEYSVPVSTVGNSLQLRAQAYRTSQVLIGSGLFWLVLLLSGMTTWMLIGTWRHTRRETSVIAKLAGSSMLRRTLDHVFALPFAAPSALVFARAKLPHARELFIVGQEHHHALVESIEQRQGARAESIAREHARLSRRNLESVLTNEEILSCVPGSTLLRA